MPKTAEELAASAAKEADAQKATALQHDGQQVANTPEFDRVARALHQLKANADTAGDGLDVTDPEVIKLRAELHEARAGLDAVIGGGNSADETRVADAQRTAMEEAVRMDTEAGRVRFGHDGHAFSPSLHDLSKELIIPIPDTAVQNPIGRAVHLPTDDPAVQNLQYLNDHMLLAAAFRGRDKTPRDLPIMMSLWKQQLAEVTKGDIMAPVSGVGADWIPTFFSATLIQDVYLATTVTNLFPRFNMASDTVRVPTLLSRPTPYRAAGATQAADWATPAVTPSTVGTGYVTFDAEMIKLIIGHSDEIAEDSIVAIAPLLRTQAIDAMAEGLEDAIINGSVLLTDLDNDSAGNELWATTTGTTDVRNAWDGLRKLAVTAGSTRDAGGTGAFDRTDLLQTKALMHKYALQRSQCSWVTGVDAEPLVLDLDELITLEKYGPQATIKTGEIGRLFGYPTVISPLVYGPNQGVGLNASGVWDNTTTTTTIMMLVYAGANWLGDRRTVRIESERSVIAGMQFIVASWRGDFQKVLPAAADTTGVLYNMIV